MALHNLVRLFAIELRKDGADDALDRLLDHHGGRALAAAALASTGGPRNPPPVDGFANLQEARAWVDARLGSPHRTDCLARHLDHRTSARPSRRDEPVSYTEASRLARQLQAAAGVVVCYVSG